MSGKIESLNLGTKAGIRAGMAFYESGHLHVSEFCPELNCATPFDWPQLYGQPRSNARANSQERNFALKDYKKPRHNHFENHEFNLTYSKIPEAAFIK